MDCAHRQVFRRSTGCDSVLHDCRLLLGSFFLWGRHCSRVGGI